ncbi:MAG TPA: GAF domain-containing protein [Salinivirgaceae bacterium]|nr:GAF domain-containing protein [Salinivirgaceae bacterium]
MKKSNVLSTQKKRERYQRLKKQLLELLPKCEVTEARMATVLALLHHKMEYFFWTGFYFLHHDRLIVKMYQGPVACMELKKDTGVCWAGINQRKIIVVPDVHAFPGHIACDSRSKSEIVVPFFNLQGELLGVLDVDSDINEAFDYVDAENLKEILEMIFNVPYQRPENLI